MLWGPAISGGGFGALLLKGAGHTQYHIRPANLLGVLLGAALFGIGMVLYDYCPGTGVAAMAGGRYTRKVGFVGMLVGRANLHSLSFTWVEASIQKVAALGRLRLPDVTGLSDWGWFVILSAIAGVVFWLIETKSKPAANTTASTGENET